MKYLLILLLSGCSTIDYSRKVEGWPDMRVEVNRVDSRTMHANCDKYRDIGEIVFACSEIWFKPPVCRVWVIEGDTTNEKHELAHCAGFDHPGSRAMANMLANSKR